MKIGVIGRGFVGGSIEKLINSKSGYEVLSYDLKDDADMNIRFDRIVRECDFIYLCVPTPMDSDGECYTGIVRSCLKLLSYYSEKRKRETVVLIKSTMVPSTSDSLIKDFPDLCIITNPEFLTERRAYQDLCESKQHVLGVPSFIDANVYQSLRKFHTEIWPDARLVFVSNIEAELIKYMTNSYYSFKVVFANHIYQLCQRIGVNYGGFIESAKLADPRLGPTHWSVPGPDGSLGFGGKCFPKDFNGMIKLFEKNGVDCEVLQRAWDYNVSIREDHDWNRIEGAVKCEDQSRQS
ncbi:MAG: hypothetical protein ACXADH_11680 [Candidatus Kariarchaeaceae archaeon]|jgi:UDPglucose 6-dehydrogenase